MHCILSTIGDLVEALLLLLPPYVSGRGESVNGDVTPTRVNSLSIVEERRQTIGLLLSFYDMLLKKFGVGEWKPMRVQAQVEKSLRMSCLMGYSSECYVPVVAGPLAPEN